MTLVEFLLARIAEDEADARKAEPGPWIGWRGWFEEGQGKRPDRPDGHAVLARDGRSWVVHEWGSDEGSVPHIARWDSARVLAECEAKRRIVQECEPFGLLGDPDVLMYLALPYADHPDYDEAWRP